MNQTRNQLSNLRPHFQRTLFPGLAQEVGELTTKQQQLIEVIEFTQLELYLPELSGTHRSSDQKSLVDGSGIYCQSHLQYAHHELLLDRLHSDIKTGLVKLFREWG